MYEEVGAELLITGLGSDAGSMLASATTSVVVIIPIGVASTNLTGLPARASAAACKLMAFPTGTIVVLKVVAVSVIALRISS